MQICLYSVKKSFAILNTTIFKNESCKEGYKSCFKFICLSDYGVYDQLFQL